MEAVKEFNEAMDKEKEPSGPQNRLSVVLGREEPSLCATVTLFVAIPRQGRTDLAELL
jgi:hypothetical protein